MGINGEKFLFWEHEMFTNCSRIVQKLMRQLMRQLMGINGERIYVFEHETREMFWR